MSTLDQLERSDLTTRIAELIQQRELQIGDQLPSIRELSVLLGEKVTTVRDALLQAQALGLVQVLPRAGAFVRRRSLANGATQGVDIQAQPSGELMTGEQNLFHVLDARRVLELELGQRAVLRRQLEDLLPIRATLDVLRDLEDTQCRATYVELDIRFHLQIAELGGNPVLLRMLQGVLEQLRPHLEGLPWGDARRTHTASMHAKLYEALVNGDTERFREEMSQHLRVAYDALLDHVRSTD